MTDPGLPRVIRFGTGRAARMRAMDRADALRHEGVAARALFKMESGGWVVAVTGWIRTAADGASHL